MAFPNLLDLYPRTVCACEICRIPCRVMPGCLGPGDAERMAEAQGVDPRDQDAFYRWAESCLAASDGALVLDRESAVPRRIRTIVPQQRADGSCVFLDDGCCGVHAVSPFGCVAHDMHMSGREGSKRSSAMLIAIDRDVWYLRLWEHLASHGKRPIGLVSERRANLQRLLEAYHEQTAMEGSRQEGS